MIEQPDGAVAFPKMYNGRSFRSPIEAQWAQFFDSVDWNWTYELTKVPIPGGVVVPDFDLPHFGVFFEVKTQWTANELERYFACAAASGKPLFTGGPNGFIGLVDHEKRYIHAAWVGFCVECGQWVLEADDRRHQGTRCKVWPMHMVGTVSPWPDMLAHDLDLWARWHGKAHPK